VAYAPQRLLKLLPETQLSTAVHTIAQPAHAAKAETALDRLAGLLAEDMKQVNREIIERLHSDVEMIPQLATYIVAAGGKRLRPLLAVASARACGYEGDRHQKLSAAVEFIHTATLLHDDVVDESNMRRGRESANAVFGNQASVLVGDFLFSRAFQLMVEDGSLEVLRILSTASAVIAEGEVLQLQTTNDISTGLNSYLDVIRCKTAALFAAATEIGAVIAERSPEEQEAMRLYGEYLGIAFQMADDMLDYEAEREKLGKTVGDDFMEGKMTLPVVLAMENATAEELAFWTRTMRDLDQRDGDLEQAQDIFKRHGVHTRGLEMAHEYGRKAHDALAGLPASDIRDAMDAVIDFSIERDH